MVVADVSGKGIPASLLMAKLSSDVRYCLASEPVPAEAVGRLNRTFCESGWEDRFVTMVLAVLDPRRHEVTMVNAGHLPPLVAARGGGDRGGRGAGGPPAAGRRRRAWSTCRLSGRWSPAIAWSSTPTASPRR